MPRNYQFSDAERERSRDLEKARRARMAELPKQFGKEERDECLQAFDHACAYCGTPELEKKLEFDHYIDLHSDDCPGTIPGNMLPSCHTCNRKKGWNGAKRVFSPEVVERVETTLKLLGASWLS